MCCLCRWRRSPAASFSTPQASNSRHSTDEYNQQQQQQRSSSSKSSNQRNKGQHTYKHKAIEMKFAVVIAAATAAAVSGAPAVRGGSQPASQSGSQLVNHCASNFEGEVVQLQMVSNAQQPNAQFGLVHDFCKIDANGTQVLLGLENVDPKVPTIAATMLKTARAVDPAKLQTHGNPAIAICRGYGGADAAFVAFSLFFTDAVGASDMCVFGDGSMVSAWTLAYVGSSHEEADSPFQAIRDAVSDEQVLLGVKPPGNIFAGPGPSAPAAPVAPADVAMDWACFGKCNAREQLLCASFATIPFVGWAKAAACVALIGSKCGLECK